MNEPTSRDVLDALVDFRSAVEARFDKVEEHLMRHDQRFDSVDRRLGRIETRLEAVESC
jgi:hypothetical protein